jgi:fimbrial chaperone protein
MPSKTYFRHVQRALAAIFLIASSSLSGFPGFAGNAWAGMFSVTPVRIYMTPRDKAVAVTVTNEGDTEVVLQADLNEWRQLPDGTDEQVPTEDLILSPPIVKLAPNTRQVIRLALLRPADASRQLTYRMILREVPEALPNVDKTIQVPISLALSMPVFITPVLARRDVSCKATRASEQTVNVTCSNTGTAYAQVREVLLKRGEVTLARFEGGSYILPGAQKIITLTGEQPITSEAVQISVSFDDGKSQNFDAVLAP